MVNLKNLLQGGYEGKNVLVVYEFYTVKKLGKVIYAYALR